jgi:AraC-like DNA-binding protein
VEKAYKLEFANEETDGLFVNCCGCSRTEPLHSFGPALKPHFLIHYVLSGKGKFILRGQEYFLEAGSGFLIEPGELAFYQSDEKEPWTYVWVGFGGNRAADYMEKMGLSANYPIFHCKEQEALYDCVRNMLEHNTSGVANDLRRNGELSVFLSLIAAGMSMKETDGEDKANTYVKKAIAFIRSNYCNPIKVTDVADFVCVNRSYLYTLFETSIGMPPQKFLSAYRLTKAAELLQATDIPVESIALSCGYNDALVFTKAFKQMKGVSPSLYRKQIKNGEERTNREPLFQIEDFMKRLEESGSFPEN